MTRETEQAAPPSTPGQSEGRLVARNTAYLAGSQILTIPLAVVMNAMFARYLGPVDFGLIYLAVTMSSFGIMVMEWGQSGVLPALIARDRSQAASLLGTGLAWRGMAACIVYPCLVLISLLLGHPGLFQFVLVSCFVQALWSSIGAAFKDAIRGFERTDIPALAHIAEQLLLFVVVVPLMLLGGRLHALLTVGLFLGLFTILGLFIASKRVGIGQLRVRRENFGLMLHMGTPFFFAYIATAIVPFVDALFLARLVPEEVVGWYSVTRRLVGLLTLPATALIGSLYPTLCRLWEENKGSYAETVRDSLAGIALVAAPAALGCALFPQIGVAVFGEEGFGPAEQNLRVMAIFLFLVYFSMPLSTALLAAGKRRTWTLVQLICIVTGLALDPILIPWSQSRFGNGGIGLCISSVTSESMVVIAGMALLPRGVFNRALLLKMALIAACGIPMVLIAFALVGRVSPFISAPIAVAAFVAAAVMSGAISKSQSDAVRATLGRRFRRFLPQN